MCPVWLAAPPERASFAEIGSLPRRDRSSSGSRSVEFRLEIGSLPRRDRFAEPAGHPRRPGVSRLDGGFRGGRVSVRMTLAARAPGAPVGSRVIAGAVVERDGAQEL